MLVAVGGTMGGAISTAIILRKASNLPPHRLGYKARLRGRVLDKEAVTSGVRYRDRLASMFVVVITKGRVRVRSTALRRGGIHAIATPVLGSLPNIDH